MGAGELPGEVLAVPSQPSPSLGTVQRCDDCGAEFGALATVTRCTHCGGLLALEYKPPTQRGKKLRARFDGRRSGAASYVVENTSVPLDASGVWRYRELVLPDADPGDIVTYPEGNTPLLQQLEDDRLLTDEAIWVDGVGEVDAESFGGFTGEPHAVVEVATHEERARAVGQGLRQLA